MMTESRESAYGGCKQESERGESPGSPIVHCSNTDSATASPRDNEGVAGDRSNADISCESLAKRSAPTQGEGKKPDRRNDEYDDDTDAANGDGGGEGGGGNDDDGGGGDDNDGDDGDSAPDSQPSCVGGSWIARNKEIVTYTLALWAVVGVVYCSATNTTRVALLYIAFFCLLIPIRLWNYCQRHRSQFLLDACYVINVGAITYILVVPSNGTMFNIMFTQAHANPAFATFMYQNSLDLRNYGQLTSTLIHFGPLLVMTLVRWHPAATIYGGEYNLCLNDPSLWCSPWVGIGIGVGTLWVHATLYFMFTFCVDHNKAGHADFMNNWTYMRDVLATNIPAFSRQSECFQKFIFASMYVTVPGTVALLSLVCLHYQYADYALCALCFASLTVQAGKRQGRLIPKPKPRPKAKGEGGTKVGPAAAGTV